MIIQVILLVTCSLVTSWKILDYVHTDSEIVDGGYKKQLEKNRRFQNIVGGAAAAIGAFPYQVSLRNKSGHHFCGGSIIDDRTILSAAHCFIRIPEIITAVVGTNYLSLGGASYNVSNVVCHEDFDNSTMFHDVAILKVSTQIKFNDFVQPIKLSNKYVGAHRLLTVSGWGFTIFSELKRVDDLQITKYHSISIDECKTHFEPIFITEEHICTLESAKFLGTCFGDSGGPLVDEEGDQVGIVSWGIPCGVKRPDVFTRVSSYLDWIASYMHDSAAN